MKPQEQPLRVSKMKNEKQTSPGKASKPKAKAPKSESIVISFRLSLEEFEPYKEPLHNSGLGRSEFFRQLFRDNKSKVVISEKKVATKDYNQYLHLVNKISNNINQLARLLNGAEKAGKATRQQYLTGLNNLNSIRLLLQSKLGGKG